MALIPPITECRDISLKPNSEAPLYQQLYQALRARIMNKSLLSGQRLPGSREIAKELGVSRNTVQLAFTQLQTEGYLEAKIGSGVYVSALIPDEFHQISEGLDVPANRSIKAPYPALSEFAMRCQEHADPQQLVNKKFYPGIPDYAEFPHNIWLKIWHQQLRSNPLLKPTLLEQALCDHLRYARGIQCDPEQVFITNGSAQALYLAASTLLNPVSTVAVEEPSYFIKKKLAHVLGAKVITCPVDSQGLCIEQLPESPIQFIYTTPTHQYPLGSNMPISRRVELLRWSLRNSSYIIEDDYDSEFHHSAKPLPSLQSLDQHGRVLYMGSLSKTLLPSLRLGYLIVPKHLVPVFKKVQWMTGSAIDPIRSSVAAEFIQKGHFARHLKKMRLLYKKKLTLATNLCNDTLSKWCKTQEPTPGMHLVLIFKNKLSDQKIKGLLRKNSIYCNPLSDYYQGGNKKNGLVLGVSHMQEKEIIEGVDTIKAMLENLDKKHEES